MPAENTLVISHLVLPDCVVFILARCRIPFAIFDILVLYMALRAT
jgi:hypothetical protein